MPQMFKNTPNLHCDIKNRTVLGNTVIDHEVVISLLFNNSLDKKLKNYIYKHIGKSSRKKSEKWLIQKYRVEQ